MVAWIVSFVFLVTVVWPVGLSASTAKTLDFTLTKKHFEICGRNLVRKAQTLTYTCAIEIPRKKGQIGGAIASPTTLTTVFGGQKREVRLELSEDSKYLLLTTAFDSTGVDFEVSKFNDDFFAVYAQVAQIVMSEALRNHTVKFSVKTSR